MSRSRPMKLFGSCGRRALIQDRRDQVLGALHRAAARGEISPEAISEEIWDVLPCYLSYRIIQHDRPVTPTTLRALVDELLIPSLTRLTPPDATAVLGPDGHTAPHDEQVSVGSRSDGRGA